MQLFWVRMETSWWMWITDQNVLDDIFLKLGFLVTLLFSLKSHIAAKKSLPGFYRQSGSVPS